MHQNFVDVCIFNGRAYLHHPGAEIYLNGIVLDGTNSGACPYRSPTPTSFPGCGVPIVGG